jgi:hypothetical protein
LEKIRIKPVIRESANKTVEFWVPLYKKRLHDAFYPYTNGEQARISATLDTFTFFDSAGELDIPRSLQAPRHPHAPPQSTQSQASRSVLARRLPIKNRDKFRLARRIHRALPALPRKTGL